MRLLCFACNKSVSNELPDDTVLRAVAFCPECIQEVPKVTADKFFEQIKVAGIFNALSKTTE